MYVFGCGFMFGFGPCVGDDADSIYLSIIVTVTGCVDAGSLCMGDGLLYVVPFRLVWPFLVKTRYDVLWGMKNDCWSDDMTDNID